MSSEKALWSWLKRHLEDKLGGKFERVENRCVEGMPDLHYVIDGVTGWIELKEEEYPSRASTNVHVGLSLFQRAWMMRHQLHGGLVFLLVRIEGECFLFDALTAANKIGNVTRKKFESLALLKTSRRPTKRDWARLRVFLTER